MTTKLFFKEANILSARNDSKKMFNLHISNSLAEDMINQKRRSMPINPEFIEKKKNRKMLDFSSFQSRIERSQCEKDSHKNISYKSFSVRNLSSNGQTKNINVFPIDNAKFPNKSLKEKFAKLVSIYQEQPKKSTLIKKRLKGHGKCSSNQFIQNIIGKVAALQKPKSHIIILQRQFGQRKNLLPCTFQIGETRRCSTKGNNNSTQQELNPDEFITEDFATSRKTDRSSFTKLENCGCSSSKGNLKLLKLLESCNRSTASSSALKQDCGKLPLSNQTQKILPEKSNGAALRGIEEKVKSVLDKYKRREILLIEANTNLKEEIRLLKRILRQKANK